MKNRGIRVLCYDSAGLSYPLNRAHSKAFNRELVRSAVQDDDWYLWFVVKYGVCVMCYGLYCSTQDIRGMVRYLIRCDVWCHTWCLLWYGVVCGLL